MASKLILSILATGGVQFDFEGEGFEIKEVGARGDISIRTINCETSKALLPLGTVDHITLRQFDESPKEITEDA